MPKNQPKLILFNRENNINKLSDYAVKCLEDKVFSVHNLRRSHYYVDKILYSEVTNTLIIRTVIKNKKLKLTPRSNQVEIPYNYLAIIIDRKRKILKIREKCQ
jgi:hypothetical protein